MQQGQGFHEQEEKNQTIEFPLILYINTKSGSIKP